MLTKDDCVSWRQHRGSIHVLLGHGVQLLEFGGLPVGPVGKGAKLATSERSKALFGSGSMNGGVQRANQKVGIIFMWERNRGAGTNIVDHAKLIDRQV